MRINLKSLMPILLILTIVNTHVFIRPASSEQLSLKLSKAVESIPSDGRGHPAFYLTLEDGKGKPHPLPYPINVTLSCSDEWILKVPGRITINPATYYVIINASSTVSERKTVEVTASSSGFTSSRINLMVGPSGGTPRSLKLTIMPNIIMPLKKSYAKLVITLVDAYGNPTKARTDVVITLSSSNLNIATLETSKINIPKGDTSVKTWIITTGLPGQAAITASASGLGSAIETLDVRGQKPEKIYIWTNTYHLLNEPGYVFLAVTDANYKPVKVSNPVTINLYSSDPYTFTVQKNVTIDVGEWYAFASLTCMGTGTATIYASSENVTTGQIQIQGRSEYEEPYAIRVYSLANSFPADENSYTAILVQLVDKSGRPTKARGIRTVDLYTSNAAIFEVAPQIIIPSGRSKANVTGTPKISGNVKITAVSSGLLASETNVEVYTPIPSSISLIAPPIHSEEEVDACLLFLSGGAPVSSQQDTQIILTSSDTGIGDGNGSTILHKKNYFTFCRIQGRSPGQFYLTASAGGMPTMRTSLSVQETKPSTFYMSYIPPVINYEFPIILQLISSHGGSAVAYEELRVNLASSNTSSVSVPEIVEIPAESPEILIFGKGLSTSASTLTISSQGFKSLTAQIKPAPINVAIRII
ncbi:MAG: hypothetical protein ACUVV4_04355 [Candidatus Bathyarchaeia archaeon]